MKQRTQQVKPKLEVKGKNEFNCEAEANNIIRIYDKTESLFGFKRKLENGNYVIDIYSI